MTQEEKAKAYDKAIKNAKIALDCCDSASIATKNTIYDIFPELKKSEDDRIRNALISILKSDFEENTTIFGISVGEIIAYLEKQGEKLTDPRYKYLEELLVADDIYQMAITDNMVQEAKTKAINALSELGIGKLLRLEKQGESIKIKKGKTYLCTKTHKYAGEEWREGIKYYSPEDYSLVNQGCTYYCPEYSKEEHNNFFKEKEHAEIKPKFKVGDWIVNKGHSYLIAYIDYEQKRYLFEIGGYTHEQLNWEYIENADNKYHLWTVDDANDGDVLAEDSCIFIIQNLGDNGTAAKTYYTLYNDGDFDYGAILYFDVDSTKPATKEQHDAIIKAMKDAGWEFDFTKKELKKIEDEEYNGKDYGIDSLWHAKNILEKTLGKVDGYQSDDGILEHKCAISAIKKYYQRSNTEVTTEDRFINK